VGELVGDGGEDDVDDEDESSDVVLPTRLVDVEMAEDSELLRIVVASPLESSIPITTSAFSTGILWE
jgi:hypothetical protein